MATSSYVGIDVSKDRLDVAVLGEKQAWQVCNTQAGIKELAMDAGIATRTHRGRSDRRLPT